MNADSRPDSHQSLTDRLDDFYRLRGQLYSLLLGPWLSARTRLRKVSIPDAWWPAVALAVVFFVVVVIGVIGSYWSIDTKRVEIWDLWANILATVILLTALAVVSIWVLTLPDAWWPAVALAVVFFVVVVIGSYWSIDTKRVEIWDLWTNILATVILLAALAVVSTWVLTRSQRLWEPHERTDFRGWLLDLLGFRTHAEDRLYARMKRRNNSLYRGYSFVWNIRDEAGYLYTYPPPGYGEQDVPSPSTRLPIDPLRGGGARELVFLHGNRSAAKTTMAKSLVHAIYEQNLRILRNAPGEHPVIHIEHSASKTTVAKSLERAIYEQNLRILLRALPGEHPVIHIEHWPSRGPGGSEGSETATHPEAALHILRTRLRALDRETVPGEGLVVLDIFDGWEDTPIADLANLILQDPYVRDHPAMLVLVVSTTSPSNLKTRILSHQHRPLRFLRVLPFDHETSTLLIASHFETVWRGDKPLAELEKSTCFAAYLREKGGTLSSKLWRAKGTFRKCDATDLVDLVREIAKQEHWFTRLYSPVDSHMRAWFLATRFSDLAYKHPRKTVAVRGICKNRALQALADGVAENLLQHYVSFLEEVIAKSGKIDDALEPSEGYDLSVIYSSRGGREAWLEAMQKAEYDNSETKERHAWRLTVAARAARKAAVGRENEWARKAVEVAFSAEDTVAVRSLMRVLLPLIHSDHALRQDLALSCVKHMLKLMGRDRTAAYKPTWRSHALGLDAVEILAWLVHVKDASFTLSGLQIPEHSWADDNSAVRCLWLWMVRVINCVITNSAEPDNVLRDVPKTQCRPELCKERRQAAVDAHPGVDQRVGGERLALFCPLFGSGEPCKGKCQDWIDGWETWGGEKPPWLHSPSIRTELELGESDLMPVGFGSLCFLRWDAKVKDLKSGVLDGHGNGWYRVNGRSFRGGVRSSVSPDWWLDSTRDGKPRIAMRCEAAVTS